MAKRKRLLLFLALALACGLGLWLWQTYGVSVPTLEKYERITEGMTLAQVQSVAGGAGVEGDLSRTKEYYSSILSQQYGSADAGGSRETRSWEFADGTIIATFDAKGRLKRKTFLKR